MNSLARKIENLANVAIIVVAVLLSVVLVKTYFTEKIVEANGIGLGDKINLPEMNWARSRQTVLLGLSTECHFCTESAPFYLRLKQQYPNARVVAVFPQSIQESTHYLRDLGLDVTEIRQATLASVGIKGTPILILANEHGIVTDVWKGKLNPEIESQALSKIATAARIMIYQP